MSLNHHGQRFGKDEDRDGHDSEIAKLIRKFEQQKTGDKPREFPAGRLSGDDDGELVYTISSDPEKGIVKVDFGKPVTWLGMEPKHAIELAQSLIQHARAVAKEPVAIVLH